MDDEGEVLHTCGECLRTFPSDRALTAHRRRHDEEREKCEVCGKSFRFLDNHRRRVHGLRAASEQVKVLEEKLRRKDRTLRQRNKQLKQAKADIEDLKAEIQYLRLNQEED